MKLKAKITALTASILLILSLLCSCGITDGGNTIDPSVTIRISEEDIITLEVGDTYTLSVTASKDVTGIKWSASNAKASVDQNGVVTAQSSGTVTIIATYGLSTDTVVFEIYEPGTAPDGNGTTDSDTSTDNTDDTSKDDKDDTSDDTSDNTQDGTKPDGPTLPIESDGPSSDPYTNVSASEFYADYTPATSYKDAYYRSQHGFMSGSLTVPDAAPTLSSVRPTNGGKFIRNSASYYSADGNAYYVVDYKGEIALTVYRGGAYITLEEVAAYMYAFGGDSSDDTCFPANYTSKKSAKPSSSIWGEYLRVNHSYFSGDTSQYPYEPVLPNISGCGGDLRYFEMDIGTTGAATPGYSSVIYNNGTKITRGAARIVYGRQDLNGNGTYDEGELYLFYTYNHYNDFQEYLNYYGGWGEMFGNITGGGSYNNETSKYVTPYVPTASGKIGYLDNVAIIFIDQRKYFFASFC